MKFLPFFAIIFITLLSCQKKEIPQSLNNIKSANNTITTGNLKSVKKDSTQINVNIENQIKSGTARFISFGIANQDFRKFKEKYGIDLKTENCVIDTSSAKKAKQNNIFLAKYLTEKYGKNWKKDLPFKLFGLEEI